MSEREHLLHVIGLCLSVERKGSDPFEINVREALEIMRKYLPKWKLLEDFNLDAETLNRLSTIIRLQGKWLKHRSSSLYADPHLIELKVKMMDPKQLVRILIQSWHPILELERLSLKRLKESLLYWNQLIPLEERSRELPNVQLTDPESIGVEALLNSDLVSEKAFSEVLEFLWGELKERTQETGNIPYWNFILMDTYADTVVRAYLTSFLVTYGYATLEVNLIEEETYIIPQNNVDLCNMEQQSVSVAIPLSYETWKNMRRDEEFE